MQIKTHPMTLRLISNFALGMLLMLAIQVGNGNAQRRLSPQDRSPKSYPSVTKETYNRVLDILFPRDAPTPSNTVWAVALRFRPSFKSELQIVIRRDVDRLQVIEYTSPNGNIYHTLNVVLARGGKEDAVEMAKAIRVKRREVSVPLAQVKQWYATLFDSIASTTKTLREAGEEFDKTGGESFVLDGSVYELSYEQSLQRMSFSLYDVEVDKSSSDGEFKLVQWMNRVRREVAESK